MGVREIIVAFKRVQSAQKKLYDYDVADLRAQIAAAEADKLAAMERVRKKVITIIDLLSLGRSHSAHKAMVQAIKDLDLDALAEGGE